MDLRLSMIVVLTISSAAMIPAAESSAVPVDRHAALLTRRARARCGGGGGDLVGDCGGEGEEMSMESEMSRRVLAQTRYISYAALAADTIPCRRRGNSYYNCLSHQQANPYRRGCSAITHCARG
ncbi:hypothetical protein DM860_014731 [Cuscuta australis]|uniref:Rapid alkalinization factor 1 n=1 Tax=Cuscuta australis TaxID=267555 RepID=A0A328DM89_9ASTE|nr:hypothetical protein DM860_014731 [Cuscuta australis]